jgi:hypothetical protein
MYFFSTGTNGVPQLAQPIDPNQPPFAAHQGSPMYPQGVYPPPPGYQYVQVPTSVPSQHHMGYFAYPAHPQQQNIQQPMLAYAAPAPPQGSGGSTFVTMPQMGGVFGYPPQHMFASPMQAVPPYHALPPPQHNMLVHQHRLPPLQRPTSQPSTPQPAPTVDDPVPCEHNNWDNLRAKNSIVTLCCRDCQKKYKQMFPIRNLCPEFHTRLVCAFGTDCPFLHVHRFKSVAKSPNPPGHVVGSVRNARFASIAIDVLADNPGKEPRDVVSEVRARYQALTGHPQQAQQTGSGFIESPTRTGASNVPDAAPATESGSQVHATCPTPSRVLPDSFFPVESQKDYWSDENSDGTAAAVVGSASLLSFVSPSSAESTPINVQVTGSNSQQQHPQGTGRSFASSTITQDKPAAAQASAALGLCDAANGEGDNPFVAAASIPQNLHPVQLPNGQIVYVVPSSQ